MSTRNQIRMGVLYRSDGTHFASYIRANLKGKILPPDRPPDGIVWSKNRLTHSSQVRLDRRELGWLYLESDITDLQELLYRFEQWRALIALGSLLLVYLLLAALQRGITGPIQNLSPIAPPIHAATCSSFP